MKKRTEVNILVMVFIMAFCFSEMALAGGAGPGRSEGELDCDNLPPNPDACTKLYCNGWPAPETNEKAKLYGVFTVRKNFGKIYNHPTYHFSVHSKLERGFKDNTDTAPNPTWFYFPTNLPTDWLLPTNLCTVEAHEIKALYKHFACKYGYIEAFNLPYSVPTNKMLVPVIENLHIVERNCRFGKEMIRGYVVLSVVEADKPAQSTPE